MDILNVFQIVLFTMLIHSFSRHRLQLIQRIYHSKPDQPFGPSWKLITLQDMEIE